MAEDCDKSGRINIIGAFADVRRAIDVAVALLRRSRAGAAATSFVATQRETKLFGRCNANRARADPRSCDCIYRHRLQFFSRLGIQVT